MLDVSVIILTYNEELHIKRCIENVLIFAKEIFVIDCFSTDNTLDICQQYDRVQIVQHKWPGNQAAQLNWALANIDIQATWILRVDADEYLTTELIDEIKRKIPYEERNISGIYLQRRHIFMGKVMKYDSTDKILRLFRKGKAVCENNLMDEYMNVLEGNTIVYDNLFYDHNLSSIAAYCEKHINYASREVAMHLNTKYNIANSLFKQGDKSFWKRRQNKALYYQIPLFWRSFAFFLYRYILKGAFLGGKEAFIFNFIQAWWYRNLVDSILVEVNQACGQDPQKIKVYMQERYNIRME